MRRPIIRLAATCLAALAPYPVLAQAGAQSGELPAVGEPVSSAPAVQLDQPQAAQAERAKTYGPALPATFNARGGLPLLDWGDAPPSVPAKLAEAVSKVSQRNPSVVAAWYAVRASDADLRAAKWRRFPTLSAQLNTWSRGTNQAVPSIQLGLPVYTFGRIGAGINKAEAEQALAVNAWRQRVLELAAAVSQAYYQYLLSAEREAILTEGVAEHENLVASIERRVRQEVSPLADLELARGRSAQVQQDLNIAASQRRTALSVLRELIQDPQFEPGAVPTFAADSFTETWNEAEQEALDYDPARERLRAQALAASYEISAAKAAIFPQVDAVYSYDEVFGSRVGLALKLQSAPGLSQLAQVSGAQARYSQALSQIGDLERQLRQDVAGQVILYGAARARASISTQASATAGRVSASYVRQFIAGRRSWLDVMNAVRENISARLSETEAKFTVMSTNSQLYLRTGKWQPEIQEGGK